MVSVANQGWSPPVGRSICIAFMLLSAGLLASCNPVTVSSGSGADIDVLDKVRSLDTLPRYPQQANAAEANAGQRSRPVMFEGTEVSDVAEARPQPVATGNGFELNFENTPIATVAKVVLGDILQTGYTIDPRVQGTVSLVSVRPVAKSDIVFVLENALRLSGIVLVRDTAGYRLTPHSGGYRAQLRPRLDARSIDRDFSDRQQRSGTRDRGTRKDRGFRRQRSQPKSHQVSGG